METGLIARVSRAMDEFSIVASTEDTFGDASSSGMEGYFMELIETQPSIVTDDRLRPSLPLDIKTIERNFVFGHSMFDSHTQRGSMNF
jgi:hypothetical protein